MARKKGKKPDALPANNVHMYREELGLRKVELARMADLSDKTIQRIERREQNFQPITYRRIFNALNRERKKQGRSELTYEEVFPS